jgi:hypothetical protein
MKPKKNTVWIAIRSQRGFITDAAVFESEHAAQVRERRWRNSANRDYDESVVLRRTVKFRAGLPRLEHRLR